MKLPVPILVGLTGGIGTGKSIIAKIFETFGIPCFNADKAAKKLMQSDIELMAALKEAFGADIYEGNELQRTKLSEIVFNDSAKLSLLNSIVHPATIAYGNKWMHHQTSPYVLKEAAILIESGSYKDMDYIIGVDAPMDVRIARVMQRDRTDEAAVQARMSKQMDNSEKMQYCDFVIQNDDITSALLQAYHIHCQLLEKIQANL